MIASLVSSTTGDLSACPILDIVEKGDASTSFLVSSDSAIFTLGNLMISDIIFGTTVIGGIYEMEHGRNVSHLKIQKEYEEDLKIAINMTQ